MGGPCPEGVPLVLHSQDEQRRQTGLGPALATGQTLPCFNQTSQSLMTVLHISFAAAYSQLAGIFFRCRPIRLAASL